MNIKLDKTKNLSNVEKNTISLHFMKNSELKN